MPASHLPRIPSPRISATFYRYDIVPVIAEMQIERLGEIRYVFGNVASRVKLIADDRIDSAKLSEFSRFAHRIRITSTNKWTVTIIRVFPDARIMEYFRI